MQRANRSLRYPLCINKNVNDIAILSVCLLIRVNTRRFKSKIQIYNCIAISVLTCIMRVISNIRLMFLHEAARKKHLHKRADLSRRVVRLRRNVFRRINQVLYAKNVIRVSTYGRKASWNSCMLRRSNDNVIVRASRAL